MTTRKKLRQMTNGRCFYCGNPTLYKGKTGDGRDWMLLGKKFLMAREHKTPTIRGGRNESENYVPSCMSCNSKKAMFKFDEFRFALAFRSGSLNYRFAGEAPASIERDWLCCHSREFERTLVIHNIPSAATAYALHNARSRMGRG